MTDKKTIEECARRAHEANRAHCVSHGDDSQPSWEDAPEWQQSSAIEGVSATLADPNLTPEQSHIGWFKHKVADGWVYGPAKDPEAKTHPCLVSYSELPENQRVKDSIFQAVVRSTAIICGTKKD